MTAIRSIAEFVTHVTVPEQALKVAHAAFLDTIGVTLAGAVEPAAQKVQQLAALEAGAIR